MALRNFGMDGLDAENLVFPSKSGEIISQPSNTVGNPQTEIPFGSSPLIVTDPTETYYRATVQFPISQVALTSTSDTNTYGTQADYSSSIYFILDAYTGLHSIFSNVSTYKGIRPVDIETNQFYQQTVKRKVKANTRDEDYLKGDIILHGIHGHTATRTEETPTVLDITKIQADLTAAGNLTYPYTQLECMQFLSYKLWVYVPQNPSVETFSLHTKFWHNADIALRLKTSLYDSAAIVPLNEARVLVLTLANCAAAFSAPKRFIRPNGKATGSGTDGAYVKSKEYEAAIRSQWGDNIQNSRLVTVGYSITGGKGVPTASIQYDTPVNEEPVTVVTLPLTNSVPRPITVGQRGNSIPIPLLPSTRFVSVFKTLPVTTPTKASSYDDLLNFETSIVISSGGIRQFTKKTKTAGEVYYRTLESFSPSPLAGANVVGPVSTNPAIRFALAPSTTAPVTLPQTTPLNFGFVTLPVNLNETDIIDTADKQFAVPSIQLKNLFYDGKNDWIARQSQAQYRASKSYMEATIRKSYEYVTDFSSAASINPDTTFVRATEGTRVHLNSQTLSINTRVVQTNNIDESGYGTSGFGQ